MHVGRWQQEQEHSPAGCHKGHEAARGPRRAGGTAGPQGAGGRDAATIAGRGSLRRAAPCWPWLSGIAEGRKDAAAGAKDTLGSGNSRSPGDEDQQPREAVTPLPARKETSEGMTGHGSSAARAEGAQEQG